MAWRRSALTPRGARRGVRRGPARARFRPVRASIEPCSVSAGVFGGPRRGRVVEIYGAEVGRSGSRTTWSRGVVALVGFPWSARRTNARRWAGRRSGDAALVALRVVDRDPAVRPLVTLVVDGGSGRDEPRD